MILTASRPIDAAMIARARRCLLIVQYGPAGGAAINLEAARTAGIYVAATPDEAPDAWAARVWHWIAQHPGMASSRSRVRLGLVGLGSVGRAVAELARREGMKPWAYDPFVDDETFDNYGVARAPLEELLGMANVVSVHVAPGQATRGLLDRARLALLAPGAWFVLASAPSVVEAEALAVGLARGRPAVAVWPEDAASLARRYPALATQPGVRPESAFAPGACPDPLARRRAAAGVAALVLGGARPPHLLVDPPCPRHVLWLVGRGWE